MPEHLEIEIKFVLSSPAAVRAALLKLGAVPSGRHAELNVRLDDARRSLSSRDSVLRLRRSVSEAGTEYLLTVKTPEPVGESPFAVRREIEFAVSDGDALLAALEVLGYLPYWRYEKRRETYAHGAVTAVIDEMPFGWFMEIEGPQHDIALLAAELGLDLADGLALSYSEIFDRVCQALGLDPVDLTFEAFSGITVPPQVFYDMRG
jgi:adenylate cyclase class 2